MGREILYCASCQTQLREADFGKGQAFRIGHRAVCAACAPGLVRSLPPDDMRELLKQMAVAGKPPPASSRDITPRRPTPKVAPKTPIAMYVGLGAGALVLIAPVVLLLNRSEPPPPPPKVVVRPPEPPPKEDTSLRELSELETGVRPLVEREAFKDAIAVYEGAKARRPAAEWKALLDGKANDLRKEAQRRLETLIPLAEAAKREGGDVETHRARVARWGLPEHAGTLDAKLAALPAPDLRVWQPIFDGRTLSVLTASDHRFYKVDADGFYRAVKAGAAQSARVFDDGEIRIRFEIRSGSFLGLGVRQGAEGSFGVAFDGSEIPALRGSTHEVIFRCDGDTVTATLDGKPRALVEAGKARKGHIQFNGPDGDFRISAVDFRPLR